jgi:hypothetical protein
MLTPAGKKCPYFYGDYYRGKNHEECRLLKDHNIQWHPRLCNTCPMPEIYLANNCEHMQFTPELKNTFLWFGQNVKLTAFCTKSARTIKEPKIGCGECHPLLDKFFLGDHDNNSTP